DLVDAETRFSECARELGFTGVALLAELQKAEHGGADNQKDAHGDHEFEKSESPDLWRGTDHELFFHHQVQSDRKRRRTHATPKNTQDNAARNHSSCSVGVGDDGPTHSGGDAGGIV